jgi:hypothetical protein
MNKAKTRNAVIASVAIILTLTCGIYVSYAHACKTARHVMRPYSKYLFPAGGRLYFFGYLSRIGPTWVFYYYPGDALSDPYEVEVSFFGRLLSVTTLQIGMWDYTRGKWLLVPDPHTGRMVAAEEDVLKSERADPEPEADPF